MKACLFVVCACTVALSGCSTRFWYDTVRATKMQECEKLIGTERTECMRRVQPDYDTYQKERGETTRAP